MSTLQLTDQLQADLCRLLAAHQVTVGQPRERMLQLNAVPVGPYFNHRCTNVLLRESPSPQLWSVFVDEDLVYQGTDRHRQAAFHGPARQGWLQLMLERPLAGDINEAIARTLDWLESDMRQQVGEVLRRGVLPRPAGHSAPDGPGAHLDDRIVRRIDLADARAGGLQPTSAQVDAIARAAETVIRRFSPRCPLIIGPPGTGKTIVARWAAHDLIERQLVEQVVEICGSALCAGSVFLADRDERLRSALEGLSAKAKTLVILEQFDLALARSSAAASLVADSLDRGARIIAVTRGEFNPAKLRRFESLGRRLEPVVVRPSDPEELAAILQRQAAQHPLASSLELAPDILSLVRELSARRPGANPGAALGLFEAVVNRAAFSGRRCVGPDDIFHLFPKHPDS